MATRTKERWQSYIHGKVYVTLFDARGNFDRVESVSPGGILHITPEERKLNQEKIKGGPAMDPFQNGFLIPRDLTGDEDDAELLANPNIITDEQIRELLKAKSPRGLADRLALITNPMTLDRFLSIAIAEDVSIRRAEAIRTRQASLRGQQALAEDEAPDDADDDLMPARRRDRDPAGERRRGRQSPSFGREKQRSGRRLT